VGNIDDAETQPTPVTKARLQDATNALICLQQARWVGHSAGEWAAAAAPQIEDATLAALVRSAVSDWHAWEQRIEELSRIARRRMESLSRGTPRVTQKPGGSR
jgi:hypothetical protein